MYHNLIAMGLYILFKKDDLDSVKTFLANDYEVFAENHDSIDGIFPGLDPIQARGGLKGFRYALKEKASHKAVFIEFLEKCSVERNKAVNEALLSPEFGMVVDTVTVITSYLASPGLSR